MYANDRESVSTKSNQHLLELVVCVSVGESL